MRHTAARAATAPRARPSACAASDGARPLALAVNSCVFSSTRRRSPPPPPPAAPSPGRAPPSRVLFEVRVAAWLWCVFTAGLDTNMHSYFSVGKQEHMSGTILQVQCFVLQCVFATVSDASLAPPQPAPGLRLDLLRLSRSWMPAPPPPTDVVAAFAFAASSAAVWLLGGLAHCGRQLLARNRCPRAVFTGVFTHEKSISARAGRAPILFTAAEKTE